MDPLFEVGSGSVKPLAFPREDAAMGLFVVKKKENVFIVLRVAQFHQGCKCEDGMIVF